MSNHDEKDFSEKIEFMPIISEDEESAWLGETNLPDEAPILTLRKNLLMPGIIIPIAAQRASSKELLSKAQKENLPIVVVPQINDVEEPTFDDINHNGVFAHVMKVMTMPDDSILAVVQGTTRVVVGGITRTKPFLYGPISANPESSARGIRMLMRRVRKQYETVLESGLRRKGVEAHLRNIESDRILLNFICANIPSSIHVKIDLLNCDSYYERTEMLLREFDNIMAQKRVADEVEDRAKAEMNRQQHEYFLNQQMRIIQDELGANPVEKDMADLMERANNKEWNEEVRAVFDKELARLQHTQPQSPDYNVQLNYLDLILDLPWNHISKDDNDIIHARKTLDEAHYGIEKVKERILEYLAVLSLKKDMKSPILCLVGPPGTGKTSLGKSIANALGRKSVRVALGGLHDESEIRGHRRTYIGAMPGRIIQNIKKAGTSNPVFILDEIDKVQTNTIQGDPTSALLEVLDPEQNVAFHDNYLDIDYDLSRVLFIATANSLSTIQPALLDRMEIIELSGYIQEEKIEIARRHLIPRQIREHGMKKDALLFDDNALNLLINEYTRESGVRQLEKAIASIVRRRAVRMVTNISEGSKKRIPRAVNEQEIRVAMGLPIHNSERMGSEPRIGVVTGLAWTAVGGEILFVECSLSKGKGTMTMTGNLGDVMKESATLAFEYLKANNVEFGVDTSTIEQSNLHIHVPEGATPKDGPSAGITMFIAMLSAFTHRKVDNRVAMTGEITLRGSVTPVGGIKEKILAAKRAGITSIVLSEENRRDIEDISSIYLEGLTFHYIKEMREAIPLALLQD